MYNQIQNIKNFMQFLKLTAEANLDLLTLFMLHACACYVGGMYFMKCESMM